MTIKVYPREPPPRILVDDWTPPPRPGRRRRLLLTVAALVASVGFVTSRASVWERDIVPSPQSSIPSPRHAVEPPSPSRAPAVDPSPPPAAALDPPLFDPPPDGGGGMVPPRAIPIVPGYLAINSKPSAELAVNGHVVGNTPQPRITVPPGHYVLVLTRDGFQTVRTWVTVGAGDTVRVNDLSLKPIAP